MKHSLLCARKYPFCFSPSGKGLISGHADGTIIRFMFEDDGTGLAGVSYIIANTPTSVFHCWSLYYTGSCIETLLSTLRSGVDCQLYHCSWL